MIKFAKMLNKQQIKGHTALLPFDVYNMKALVIIIIIRGDRGIAGHFFS